MIQIRYNEMENSSSSKDKNKIEAKGKIIMANITIIKGEEFKIAVKEKIKKDDLFMEQYERAAGMLDKIVRTSAETQREKDLWSWKSQDFENNIIAFCGERGEGKSSVMITFVNALYQDRNNEIFTKCKNLINTNFAEPIVIDPSLFDGVHNVLDIVLAKLFRKFYECYNNDHQHAEERTRENLLDRFQRVYRYVSLINNQKQMLDDEFDYEGNISKLTKLGESTNLKEELAALIRDYLDFMENYPGNPQLLIAIDDLDLCSANAYKMAEQIRKYLMIPHVCILMSVNVEQLELCIREKNLKEFREIYKNRNNEVYAQLNREVQTMAERYVSKLIPGHRRIYLPKVQRFEDVRIIYKEAGSKENIIDSWKIAGIEKNTDVKESVGTAGENDLKEKTDSDKTVPKNQKFTLSMLDLIYDRTGMRFLPEADGGSYLLPDNLRDMISWILMIAEMEDLKDADEKNKDKIYFENIQRLETYFVREWSGDQLKFYEGLTLQDMSNMDIFHLNVVVQRMIKDMYNEVNKNYFPQSQNMIIERLDSFFQVMGWFELFRKNVADIEKEAYVYRMGVLYTIRIHKMLRKKQYVELRNFFNGYIWGTSFSGLLPMHTKTNIDRSRFAMRTVVGFNAILREMNLKVDGLPVPEIGKRFYVSRIAKNGARNSYIKAWIILGLFSNMYYYNNQMLVFSFQEKIISGNNQIRDFVHISLENYLVALCDLSVLYEKVNMIRLGIEKSEFEEVAEALQEENRESIQYARTIVSNMDLLVGLKDYCFENRDYKESTSGNSERTMRLVLRFFENIEKYMDKYGIKMKAESLNRFVFRENQAIDIAKLYSNLFVLTTQDHALQEQLEKNEKVAEFVMEFRKKITELPKRWNHGDNSASAWLQIRTAEHVKQNLDKLALAIQRYHGENKRLPVNLDIEALCDLYSGVVELYAKDKGATVTDEMYQEYVRLVKVQNEMKTEAR